MTFSTSACSAIHGHPFASRSRLVLLATFGLFAGCSPNADLESANKKLEAANKRIAALEAQLTPSQLAAASVVNASSPQPANPPGKNMSTAGIPRTSAPDPAGTQADTTSVSGTAPVVGEQWTYHASEAQMTGGTRRTASVDSTNTVDFGFPYNGVQHARLILRTDPENGKDVMFRLEKGQILCPSFQSCTVQVRFDDEKPGNFSATGPADHSSDVVFLNDYARFLARMRKAKRVRIAVNIYQQGSPVFEFDVSGFNAARYHSGS
jgi:hypothetical protein